MIKEGDYQRRLGAAPQRLKVAARKGLRHEVRLVTRVELVAEVFDVALDGAWSDPELLRALLRRKSASDALQDLAFSLR
jgi:hypothetical protein